MSNQFFMTVARIGKYIVPPSLRPRLREEYSYLVRKFYERRNKKERNNYLKNGTYFKWYAEQTDNDLLNNLANDLKEPAKLDWMKEGVIDLETIKKLGLKPQHTLLDFGCGFLRSGNHFIAYLNDENYFANDASGERVKYGAKVTENILGSETFKKKNPHLFISRDNSFDWVAGKKFDYIWSCSVLAHMPQEDIETLFDNIKKVMHKDSAFVFTYSCADINKFREWEDKTPKEREQGINEVLRPRNLMFIVRALKNNRGKDCIEVDS